MAHTQGVIARPATGPKQSVSRRRSVTDCFHRTYALMVDGLAPTKKWSLGASLAMTAFLVSLPCLSKAAALSLSEQAAQAWSQRAQPGETERAFMLWEKALLENPQDKQTLIDLTRAAGRAYRHANTAAQRRTWSERGRTYAQRAIEANPNSSDAWTEYGAALGQWADSHRGIQALKTVQKAVAALHKAIELKQENAFAHMLLSQFYAKSPKLFSVGDKAKALEEAMRAAQYDPNLSIARLTLGHRYLEAGKKTEAIREFQSVLRVTPAADRLPETQSDQETAKELLKALGAPHAPEALGQACTDSSQCSGACVGDPSPSGGSSAGHCEAAPLSSGTPR